jgi:hypothetical protein
MVHGSFPGERRGGRLKGTPNKATVARKNALNEALKTVRDRLGPEAIEQLGQSPANLMRFCSIEAAKAGMWQEAADSNDAVRAYRTEGVHPF